MRTGYDILLSLTINHLYFSDQVFEGFELIPEAKTSRLINDLKLLPRKKNNNWNLLFQTEGPFATSRDALNNKEFLFTLKITDPSIYSITNNTYLHGKDEMLFFNSPINSVIVPEKRKLYTIKFDYQIHHDVRPVKIIVSNGKGAELLNETVSDTATKSTNIDLRKDGENIYNISEDTVPPGALENEKIYARETSDNEPFYGAVYFKVMPIDADPASNQYKINFETNN